MARLFLYNSCKRLCCWQSVRHFNKVLSQQEMLFLWHSHGQTTVCKGQAANKLYRDLKRHINIWHINNFSVTPVTDPPGRVPEILPAGYPGENVYVPWVPHTAHKLLTPGHRSGDPGHPVGRTPHPRSHRKHRKHINF